MGVSFLAKYVDVLTHSDSDVKEDLPMERHIALINIMRSVDRCTEADAGKALQRGLRFVKLFFAGCYSCYSLFSFRSQAASFENRGGDEAARGYSRQYTQKKKEQRHLSES